jgi:hypothetical protein
VRADLGHVEAPDREAAEAAAAERFSHTPEKAVCRRRQAPRLDRQCAQQASTIEDYFNPVLGEMIGKPSSRTPEPWRLRTQDGLLRRGQSERIIPAKH